MGTQAEWLPRCSLCQGFDALTYINRASPNGAILATVSDSTGQLGKTTPIVNTVGSANVSCPGLVSQPGQSSQIRSSSISHHTAIIVAVCVTFGCLLLIFVTILYLRRKMKGQDTRPRVFKNEDGNESPRMSLLRPVHSNTSYRSDPSYHSNPSDHKRAISVSDGTTTSFAGASSSTLSAQPEIVPYVPSFLESPMSTPRAGTSTSSLTPTSPNYSSSSSYIHTRNHSYYPSSPIPSNADRRYAKLAEAHRSTREDNIRWAGTALVSPVAAGRSRVPASSQSYSAENPGHIDPDTEPDIIIQHRDGGVVQELPPPYLDHRSRRTPKNNDVGSS